MITDIYKSLNYKQKKIPNTIEIVLGIYVSCKRLQLYLLNIKGKVSVGL